MPNWCSNTVTISHDDPVLVAKLKKAVDSSEFFNALVPRPESENDNWYQWNLENWGTKWDVEVEVVDETPNSITLCFDTAWSPPTEFYNALWHENYDVDASYFESGLCYVGTYKDGFDRCFDYSDISDDPDAVRDRIGDELDDQFGISDMIRDMNDEMDDE